jgi:hypothetical protein
MPKCETLRTEKMEQVKKVITVCVFNIKRYFRTHAWVVLQQQCTPQRVNMHYHYDVYG